MSTGTVEKQSRNIRREIVLAGSVPTKFNPEGTLLAFSQDDVIRQQGNRTYEIMSYDPSCSTAMAIIVYGSIGEGPILTPAVKARPGEIVSKRKKRQLFKLADEICQFNIRGLNRLDRPVEESLSDWMYDALPFGSSPMEQTFDFVDDETGTNKLMLKSLAVKPRWAWTYKVDSSLNIKKIRCHTVDGTIEDIERNKFAILTWQMRYRDPRGNSIFRPAYPAWNYKVQQIPDYASYLKHFADPAIILTAPEHWQDETNPITGITVTVGQRLVAIGEAFQSKAILGLPFGCTATLIESKGDGQAYQTAFSWYDIEIFRSICIGTRPITEAKHGSKADTGGSLDLIGMAIKRVRRTTARAFRDDTIYWQTRLNYGKENADLLTPDCSFGANDRDIPKLLVAFADAYDKKLLKEGHLPAIWDSLGVGEPVPGMEREQGDKSKSKSKSNVDNNANKDNVDETNSETDSNGGNND